MTMRDLSDRELATVLAALRFWQDEMCPYPAGCYAEHFEGTTPLDAREIDALCADLNCGGPHEPA